MWSPRLKNIAGNNIFEVLLMIKSQMDPWITFVEFNNPLGFSPIGSLWVVWSLLKYATGSDFQYCDARWGLFGHFSSLIGIFNTHKVRQLHWNINTWKDTEVLAWKTSYMTACTAIQVTGAIFASVGLSALSLPNMDSTHWSARALLSCSMILGILSVVFAAAQQQHIGMLNNALEIRLWLSRGKVEPNKRPYDMPFNLLPLESSVSALKQFTLPKYLLNLSVCLYAIGFGIYLLYAWIYHVEQNGGRNDFRNVFIAFVTTVGLVCIYSFVLFVLSLVDEAKRAQDFELARFQSFAKPSSRKQLEEWLTALENMQGFHFKFGEEDQGYALLESKVNDLKVKWDEERKAREKSRDEARSESRKTKETTKNHSSTQQSDTSKNPTNNDPKGATDLPKEILIV